MIIEEPYILGNDLKTKEVLRQTIEMYRSKGACPSSVGHAIML